MHGGGGKQTICWHCRKPLPRCAICLMHMGSEMGAGEEESVQETLGEGEPEESESNTLGESHKNGDGKSGATADVKGRTGHKNKKKAGLTSAFPR